jgi:hypothetical protein
MRAFRPKATAGNAAAAAALRGRAARYLRLSLRRPFLRARGYRFGRRLRADPGRRVLTRPAAPGVLLDYFDNHTSGPGLWKWRHYFPVYERHLAKFVGTAVQVVEIGVYSGGSLGMWRHYLGALAHVHGVDIAPECRAYAGEGISISIGDQADPGFWREFLATHPRIDVVIDDGGHQLEQQVATLEALLPRLAPGGVYICEDIAGVHNPLHEYLAGLERNLDAWEAPDRSQSRTLPTNFQRLIGSIHRYPYLLVIERTSEEPGEFVCPRRGTEWQPF